jgi:short-subunit dehydrogenase
MNTVPMTPEQKVVLLTGASSGIGRAAALLLAKEGYLLALVARRVALLESLAREIAEQHGVAPLVLPADVSNPGDVASVVKKTYDHFGRLDVLVNNAGILRMAPLELHKDDEMRQIFETNFWAVVNAIRAAAPVMNRRGGGHIINVGSGVSRRALPYMSVYSASKFALAGLTESVRLELRRQNIAFTLVYPGGTDTEMPQNVDRSRLPPDYPDHSRSRVSAERVARAVLKAVRRRPLEIYVPWWIRPTAALSVICPSLADFLIRKAQRMD